MIRVSASPGRLCVEGHAGSAAFGHDLVCAGASMLVWTLAAQLEGRQDARVRLGAGLAEIRCAPDEPALAFAAAGLRLLAERFPEFVRLEEGQTARKTPFLRRRGRFANRGGG